jgi:hypothetical protein
MSDNGHSEAVLRFFGDDLVPEEISELLGAEPTSSVRKGEEIVGHATGQIRIAPTGRWSLNAARREPEDIEAQVFEILDRLTPNLDAWQSLSRYEPDLFCGIFMATMNDMLPLSARAIRALGQRGIALKLDIYGTGDRGKFPRVQNCPWSSEDGEAVPD